MTPRLTLALTLLAVTPALAQPAKQPARVATPDDMAAFEKEVDALFTQGGLTSDQAAARSSKISPDVKRSVAEVEVAIAQAEAAELTRVPQVGVRATYTRLSGIEPFIFAPGAPGIEYFPNFYAVVGEVAVNLSDYVVRYPKLIDAARLGYEAARVQNRSAEINVGQEARVIYYEWVRSKLQVLIAKRQLIQVRSTLGQMRALAEAQRVSRADLMRVESQEAVAEQTAIQLDHLSRLREEQLRILIGATDEQPLTIGEDIRQDITASAAGELDELLRTAKLQRLDFRALDTGIAAREKQREAEKANAYPRLVGVATGDYSRPNPRGFPQEDKFTFTWSAGLRLSWTLNDTLLQRTTDRRLRGETNQLRADRESLERGARIQLLSAQQAVANAQSALSTSAKGLAAAEEGYRVRRELLNADRATAVELVDAETELTRARIAALNARVDLRVALADLSHALGNDAK